MNGKDCYVGMKVVGTWYYDEFDKSDYASTMIPRDKLIGTVVKIAHVYSDGDVQLLCSWDGLTTGHDGNGLGVDLGKSGWFCGSYEVEPYIVCNDDDGVDECETPDLSDFLFAE